MQPVNPETANRRTTEKERQIPDSYRQECSSEWCVTSEHMIRPIFKQSAAMRSSLIIVVFLIIFRGLAQNSTPPLKVCFMESAPEIDGIADPSTDLLPVYNLTPAGTFRIAYGTGFLYIYAEVPGDSLLFRDRGYQNGDGMIVVIGRPGAGDLPTREFYVMGFTAQPDGMTNWQTKFVWYRNVDLQMSRLPEARYKAAEGNGLIAMECLIPWSEVYPYHPWLSEEIGFNLAMVKAAGDSDRNWYFLRDDDRIGNEQSPRKTVRLSFDQPVLPAGTQSYAVLSLNHVQTGESIKMRVTTCFSKDGNESVRGVLYSGENERISSFTLDQKMKERVTVTEKEIPCSGFMPGGYRLEWASVTGTSKGTLYFTVLPSTSITELMKKLELKKRMISPGSYGTIMFMLNDAKAGLDSLKPYETAYLQRTQIEEIAALVSSDEDIIATRTGVMRRGFLSDVDSTYRPYSIKIPGKPEAGKKYPLLVYLHGSGQDDRNILDRLPGYSREMIILAPNGRGTSNCYTAGHAQEDIEEAIRDVIRNYPVDTTRIILAGFSMGGYGVYRTFWEHPERYRALAVFSGSPDLGRKWIGEEQPDFLEEQYLKPFTGKQVFIFHGSEDLNIPVGTTRTLAEKLRRTGADVTFVEEAKGHESPGDATILKFRDWLKVVLE
jgi:predicted esterase